MFYNTSNFQKILCEMTPKQINWFLLFKLPSAFFTGVRVREISSEKCKTSVKYGWKNQNPFRSVFWAVQGMAAELSTGALVMKTIRESGESISMLVTQNKGSFYKKAKGRIYFECVQGNLIKEKINRAIETFQAQQVILKSRGMDEKGNCISEFEFEWSVKLRAK